MSEREHVADAFALVQAALRDDREGADAVLANCDVRAVAEVLADVLGEALKAISRALSDGDPLVLLGRMRAALAAEGGTP